MRGRDPLDMSTKRSEEEKEMPKDRRSGLRLRANAPKGPQEGGKGSRSLLEKSFISKMRVRPKIQITGERHPAICDCAPKDYETARSLEFYRKISSLPENYNHAIAIISR